MKEQYFLDFMCLLIEYDSINQNKYWTKIMFSLWVLIDNEYQWSNQELEF